ncbi:MAG: amidohydrolase family protein [Deltaproteobacteria bacterium]|nr:amidohydrolase family protein [Deltaproteobacteria bacterium]
MRFVVVVVVVGLLSGCLHTQDNRALVIAGERPSVLVVRDARVFTATSQEALEHHDVVVRGGKIEAVRPTGEEIPAGAVVVEGAGRTLLPGLVDAHAHAFVIAAPPWFLVWPEPEHVLQELLYAGTTTYHDLCAPLDDVIALRDRVAAGDVVGPRILASGPMLTAPEGYPVSMTARIMPAFVAWSSRRTHSREPADAAAAKAVVDEFADRGVALIKIALASTPDGTPVIAPAVLDAIVQSAHARGLKVVAHIDTADNALLAARHGVDVLVHGVHSSELTVEQAKEIASHKMVVAPTLLTFERLDELRREAVGFSSLERESIAPNVQHALTHMPEDYALDKDLLAWMDHLDKHRESRLVQNTKRLFDAGVPILVGTDGQGSDGSFPAGIHKEMQLLVKAGVPNADVLLGATARSAHMLLADPSFGTIEAGKDADLLLVEGNPLEDISATEKIVTLIQGGRILQRLPPASSSSEK